jgi:hypothetical protein
MLSRNRSLLAFLAGSGLGLLYAVGMVMLGESYLVLAVAPLLCGLGAFAFQRIAS